MGHNAGWCSGPGTCKPLSWRNLCWALHRAALGENGTGRPAPWPVPLYLAHGIGIGGVEPPFIGTDLGLAAEERMVLAPGMVLVLEPYVWEAGAGGYRAEVMIAITADGFERLSSPPP